MFLLAYRYDACNIIVKSLITISMHGNKAWLLTRAAECMFCHAETQGVKASVDLRFWHIDIRH